jgi:hypothetical protein
LSPTVEAGNADARSLGLMMAGEWTETREADHAI